MVKKLVKVSNKKVKKALNKFVKHAKKHNKPISRSKSNSMKLNKVLSAEKNILTEEKSVEAREASIEREEKKVEKEEKTVVKEEKLLEKIEENVEKKENREENELEKLEVLEQQIKKEVGAHPLAKITLKDIVKGLVGAFIGLAVHYTFTYGVEISQTIDIERITLLYVLCFFIGLLFIYATGFRKIKDPKILVFMPVRLIVLYAASIIMSVVVLYVFYPSFGHSFIESYKMVGGVLLAAIVGACTADLIGKE